MITVLPSALAARRVFPCLSEKRLRCFQRALPAQQGVNQATVVICTEHLLPRTFLQVSSTDQDPPGSSVQKVVPPRRGTGGLLTTAVRVGRTLCCAAHPNQRCVARRRTQEHKRIRRTWPVLDRDPGHVTQVLPRCSLSRREHRGRCQLASAISGDKGLRGIGGSRIADLLSKRQDKRMSETVCPRLPDIPQVPGRG